MSTTIVKTRILLEQEANFLFPRFGKLRTDKLVNKLKTRYSMKAVYSTSKQTGERFLTYSFPNGRSRVMTYAKHAKIINSEQLLDALLWAVRVARDLTPALKLVSDKLQVGEYQINKLKFVTSPEDRVLQIIEPNIAIVKKDDAHVWFVSFVNGKTYRKVMDVCLCYKKLRELILVLITHAAIIPASLRDMKKGLENLTQVFLVNIAI